MFFQEKKFNFLSGISLILILEIKSRGIYKGTLVLNLCAKLSVVKTNEMSYGLKTTLKLKGVLVI
jgi:hypothetical protein